MKKFFIYLTLAAVLLSGILCNVAIAKPPEQGYYDIWRKILAKVNGIIHQNNNFPMMECDDGSFTVAISDSGYVAKTYDQLRDVQLTISWQALDFNGQAVEVIASIGGENRSIFYGLEGDVAPVGTITLNFTTDSYEIHAYNNTGSESITVFYSVTSYWMP